MSNQYSTWNYVLSFRGWAQCRMATDPDPSNDLRGVSGYSFALPGEPDFTQIAYFQNCDQVVKRSHCPDIGVFVASGSWYRARVTEDVVAGVVERREEFESGPEALAPGNPLLGAKVDLLNDPRFDSRNSTIVYDGYGLISPFDFEVAADGGDGAAGVCIQRSYYVDPDNPTTDLESISIDKLTPHVMNPQLYDAVSLNRTTPGSPDMLLESGIINPSAYRHRRLQQLLEELECTADPVCRAALQKRIAELRIDDPKNRRTAQLGAKVLVPYSLNSKRAVVNGTTLSIETPWSLEMWLGGWDTDSLSFYVMGTVRIVLNFDPLSP